ncbi:hypothetical protein Sjap_007010 [Stephania japonica]|uniref:Uncharacterized protein n=1 Tax=Stephania japonica TaxID=461633 RepID=A0AAP0K9C8_9MAGN
MLQFPVPQMAQQLGSQTQAQSQPQGQQMPLQPILQTQHQGQQMTQQTTLQMQPQGQQMTQQTTLQMQPQGQQMPQQPNLQTQHQGQQMPQQTTLQTQHQGQQMTQQPLLQTQHLGQQMMHQHGQHFSHQQLHQMPYQQTPPRPQGQQMPQQQVQHYTHQQEQPFSHQQGQQFHQQVQKTGYPQREDIEFHQGKQLGISPSQSQLPRASSLHDMPVHSVQVSSIGVQSVQQQYGTSSLNRPESGSSLAQLPQNGDDLILGQQIGGTMSRNHMGPSIVQNQQSGGLPNMLKRSTEEEASGRPAGDYYFSANKDGPMMAPPQPSLPAVPMGQNQQEIRIGGIPPHIAPPGHIGGLNAAAGHGMPNMFSHGAMAQPFPNNLNMRPPMRMLSSPEVSNPSPADVYRQQHEVTATGDNVPAPFMTFEATGFPPEILREMRYLLQKRSICRRLRCYTHPDMQQVLCPLGMHYL